MPEFDPSIITTGEEDGYQYYEPYGIASDPDSDANVTEQYESITEEYATEGNTANVTIKVPWSKRQEIAQRLIAGDQGWQNQGGEHHAGARYPYSYQGDKQMELQRITVAPLRTDYEEAGQAIKYKWALLTLQYASNKPDISFTVTSEYMTLNHSEFRWKRDGKLLAISPEMAPGVLMHSHNMTVTAKRVDLSQFSLNNIEGYVNAKTITSTQFPITYDPGTLMCNAPTITKHKNADWLFDVTLNFAYREIGWTKFFDPLAKPAGSQLWKMSDCTVKLCNSSGTEIDIFPPASFAQLFWLVGIQIEEDGQRYQGTYPGEDE